MRMTIFYRVTIKLKAQYTIKIVYSSQHIIQQSSVVVDKLRNIHVPSKVRLFTWLALKIFVLTWDTLQREGWKGPRKCPLV